MEILFVNNNGTVLESSSPTIYAGNRGHLYGDGLFETIRVRNGKPLNLNVHLLRLKDGMQTLKMRLPSYFTEKFFEEKIRELLVKSNIKKGGRVRLSVDRATGGAYTPITNEVAYFIEVYPLNINEFALNSKGIEIGLYQELRKENNALANFKTKNGLIYVMASIAAKEKEVDKMLITDKNGNVLEATSSNLFIVSNGILYTPGLDVGCVGGTMRMKVINLALENNIKVYESNIVPQNLLIADEVFLTNAIQGIEWVGGFRTRRYKNDMSKKLLQIINAHYE